MRIRDAENAEISAWQTQGYIFGSINDGLAFFCMAKCRFKSTTKRINTDSFT